MVANSPVVPIAAAAIKKYKVFLFIFTPLFVRRINIFMSLDGKYRQMLVDIAEIIKKGCENK